MMKAVFFQAIAFIVAGLAAPMASAQDAYPQRTVRIVVPYPPGGATDIVTRVYAQGLTELLGQQFIVENRGGGGTNIGAAFAAHSAPDGYTLFAANFASNAVNKWLYKKLTYDHEKDFTAIAMMTISPQSPRKAAPGPTYTFIPMMTLPVTVAFG